jgi:uncharacterized membrane protein (DUF4010 family)
VGALSGLNDVDAITLSMGNLVSSRLAVNPAAETVFAAVTVNTALKGGVGNGSGRSRPRQEGGTSLGVGDPAHGLPG